MSKEITQNIQNKIIKINNVIKRINYYLKEIEDSELMFIEDDKIDCKFKGKLLRLPTNMRLIDDSDEEK